MGDAVRRNVVHLEGHEDLREKATRILNSDYAELLVGMVDLLYAHAVRDGNGSRREDKRKQRRV